MLNIIKIKLPATIKMVKQQTIYDTIKLEPYLLPVSAKIDQLVSIQNIGHVCEAQYITIYTQTLHFTITSNLYL